MKLTVVQPLRWMLGMVIASIGTGLCVQPRPADAQVVSSNVLACRLLPIADLEAKYGAKATVPKGTAIVGSSCGINLAGYVVRLQEAAPGTAGTPTSIQMGLAGAMMLGRSNSSQISKPATKDFGNVGCIKMTLQLSKEGPLAKPVSSTSCFLVEGGYLNLTMGRDDGQDVSFESVKEWLEKAAARRKS